MTAEGHTNRCVACRSAIEYNAAVCPVCKSWQKSWKNSLLFYGSFATAATVIATALFYVFNAFPNAFKKNADIQIMEFAFPGTQVLANTGIHDAFLSRIQASWPGGSASPLIRETVRAGEIYRNDMTHVFEGEYEEYAQKSFVHSQTGDGAKYSENASFKPKSDPKSCYLIQLISSSNPNLAEMNHFYAEYGQKLATIPISATLLYYTIGDYNLHSLSFSAVGAFLDRQLPECAKGGGDSPPRPTGP